MIDILVSIMVLVVGSMLQSTLIETRVEKKNQTIMYLMSHFAHNQVNLRIDVDPWQV